jgi:DNA ligase-1
LRLQDIVETSRRVAGTRSRREKIEELAATLERLEPREIRVASAYLSGVIPQGRIGIGPSKLRAALPDTHIARPTLTLSDVDGSLDTIAAISGTGSTSRRLRLLHELLARATRDERDFLARLLLGELRQGATEGLVVEAIAKAAGVAGAAVRRALMFSGDLGVVARAALTEGRSALARFSIQLFRPVQPMLAQTADEVDDALDRLERAGIEYKLDGARVQVHRSAEDVRVYTRQLNDVTAAVPELVQRVRTLPVREIILDGEALAFRSDGRPQPFQVTMRRFGRKRDVKRVRDELPLSAYYFDCLYLNGDSLVDQPAGERVSALAAALPGSLLVPRRITADKQEVERFLRSALAAGHEGIMVKSLDTPYEAGRRGKSWLKLKPSHTLDLVVLAAEWGSGRRRGWLSNLHLGARDPAADGFVMLGKTFKGLTDEMLEWQTRRLQELEVGRDERTVYVRPEMVVEIAFDGVQASPKHPGGLALRFARVRRYRADKSADQADTIETVRRIHERGGVAPT